MLIIIVLCAWELVDVMISSVVLEKDMEYIARQPEPTMIIGYINLGRGTNGTTRCVEQETLERMIIKGPNGIRYD